MVRDARLLLLLCGLIVLTSEAAAVNVIVIGAGIGGLTAARTLVDNVELPEGTTCEVTVLEARDRIGGRTYTKPAAAFNFGDASGGVLDAGASWIHGSNPEHPTTKMCDALGLERKETIEDDIQLFSSTGTAVADTGASFGSFVEILEDAQWGASDGDSLWQSMAGVTASDGKTRDSEDNQYWLSGLEFNEGGKATTIGAVTVGQRGSEMDGKEEVLPGGYVQLVDALASGQVKVGTGVPQLDVSARNPPPESAKLNILLSREVVAIAKKGELIEVTMKDGEVMQADYVISTLPLGVLKTGTPTFDPPLSVSKTDAIERLAFGNVAKISILFESAWWASKITVDWFGITRSGETARGLSTQYVNMHKVAGKPVLMTFAVGPAADAVDGMSDAAVWNATLANLKVIFGESVPPSTYKAITVQRWGTDPYARGCYSHHSTTSQGSDYAAMGSDEYGGRLLFAGEATDETFYGSAHNALLTGQRAARAVLRAEEIAPAESLNSGTKQAPGIAAFLLCAATLLTSLFGWSK